MAKMTYREAVLSTIAEEMARDERVVVLGEDVVGGMGTAGGPEAIGGIWSTSTGLWGQFGSGRAAANLGVTLDLLRQCLCRLPEAVAQRRLVTACFMFLNILVIHTRNRDDAQEPINAAVRDTLNQIVAAFEAPYDVA